jgi:hypothetical protein
MFDRPSFLSLRSSDNDVVQQTRLPIASVVLIACLVLSTYPLSGASAPVPHQDRLSTPMPRSSWWEAAWMHLIVLVLLLAGFSAYPLVALVRRMRGSSPLAPVGSSARLLAAAGVVTVLGFFVYLLYLLMSTRTVAEPGPVLAGRPLAGRPLAWLLLQRR